MLLAHTRLFTRFDGIGIAPREGIVELNGAFVYIDLHKTQKAPGGDADAQEWEEWSRQKALKLWRTP